MSHVCCVNYDSVCVNKSQTFNNKFLNAVSFFGYVHVAFLEMFCVCVCVCVRVYVHMFVSVCACIVRPESPWTKDASGRRNLLCLDASGHLIFCTQTHAHEGTQTHAKFFSYIPCPSCCMFVLSLSLYLCPHLSPRQFLVVFQDPGIRLALDGSFQKPHPPTYSAQN